MGCQSQSRMRRVFILGGERPRVGVRTEQGVRVHTKGDLVQGDHSPKRGSRALTGKGRGDGGGGHHGRSEPPWGEDSVQYGSWLRVTCLSSRRRRRLDPGKVLSSP